MDTLEFAPMAEYSVIAAVLMPYIVEWLKGMTRIKLDPRIIAGIVCGILGFIYAFFQKYFPSILLEVGAISSVAYTVGTVLYRAQKPSKTVPNN